MTPAIEAIDLVKRFGDNTAVDGVSFTVAAGHGARHAGPQRRRQDHHGADDDDADPAHQRHRPGRRLRRAPRTRQGAPQHGPHRSGRHRRRTADRPREHPDDRRPVRHPPQGPRAAGRPTAGTVFDRRRRRPRGQVVLRRHAPTARSRGQPAGVAAGAVPRRADHRPGSAQPQRSVGGAARPGRSRAPRCC